MTLIPSPYPVVHLARSVSDETDPDTNNPVIVTAAPVVRYVQSIAQEGRRGSSREVISNQVLLSTETTLSVSVADPTVYSVNDQVIINPELDDDGNWDGQSGVAFWIDGLPSDARQGPWPQLLSMFAGGVIRLRRVT